jgi:hypothetical protein
MSLQSKFRTPLDANGYQALALPDIYLSDGRRIEHRARSNEGNLAGSLLRTGLSDLKIEGMEAGYYAVRADYVVSSDRLSMFFGEDSIVCMRIGGGKFEFIDQEDLNDKSMRILIAPSGLPEAILSYANETTSPNRIRVVNNAPLAEALRAEADSMPSLREKAAILVGAHPFVKRF